MPVVGGVGMSSFQLKAPPVEARTRLPSELIAGILSLRAGKPSWVVASINESSAINFAQAKFCIRFDAEIGDVDLPAVTWSRKSFGKSFIFNILGVPVGN